MGYVGSGALACQYDTSSIYVEATELYRAVHLSRLARLQDHIFCFRCILTLCHIYLLRIKPIIYS